MRNVGARPAGTAPASAREPADRPLAPAGAGSDAWSAEARWQATLQTVGMRRPGDVPLPSSVDTPPPRRRAPSASRRGAR